MNTKTTKFLAVLAVLAVAFAVFAVVVPAESNDAGTISADMTISENKDTWTATELAYDEIYVSATAEITVDGAFTSDIVTFYVLADATATFNFTAAQDATITFMAATSGTASVDDTEISMTAVATGAQFTMAATSTALTMGVTTAAEFTVPADEGMYVAEKAEVSVAASATMTITGTLETEGTITNAGTIVAGKATLDDLTEVTGHVVAVGSAITGYTGSTLTWDTVALAVTAEDSEVEAYYVSYSFSSDDTMTGFAVSLVDGSATLTAPVYPIQTVIVGEDATLTATGVGNGGLIDVYGKLIVDTDLTNSGTVIIEKGATFTMTETEVTNDGAMIFDADVTVDATTFTNTNGTVYVENGVLDYTADVYAENGQFAVTGGTLKIQSESETSENGIAWFSGKIYHVDSEGNATDRTSLYSETGTIEVSDMDEVAQAIEGGATDIVLDTAAAMVEASQDIIVPAGVTLTIDNGVAITLATTDNYKIGAKGGKIVGDIKVGDDSWSISLAGSYTLAAGSLIVDGTITGTGNTITPDDSAKTVITGTLAGALNIVNNNGNVYFDNFTVASTGVLTLEEGNAYYVKSDTSSTTYMYIYGKVTCASDADVGITVEGISSAKKATVVAYNGATIYGNILIEGTDYYSIDLSAAMKVLEINTDITKDKEFGQLEDVIVVESLTISNGAKVTVYGSFTIADGKTVTLEDGAELYVDSSVAKVDLSGRLVVESGTSFVVNEASAVSISGALVSEGYVEINTGTTVKKGGYIDIKDDTNVETDIQDLTVNAGGSVTLRATVNPAAITNKGTVTLQNVIMEGDITVNMAGNDATVEIKSVTGPTDANATAELTVTDEGMSFGAYDYTPEVPSKTVTYVNSVSFEPEEYTVKGLTVTETITSYEIEGYGYYQNNMILSGTVTALDDDGQPSDGFTIATAGEEYLQVDDTLTIGEYIILDVGGILKVNGLLTAVATGSQVIGTDGTTEIYAYGMIVAVKQIGKNQDIMNGAMYTTENDDGTTLYVYVPLLDALEAGADTITIYGVVYVDENYTVPSTATIKLDATALVYIGSINGDTVVTVENGAAVKGDGTIYVEGTLIYENKKDSKVTTISDVYVAGDVGCMYTNIYTALANAQPGDTVTLAKSAELAKNVTVKDGVELYVPATYILTIDDGVTLTVNGVLNTVEPVEAETAFAEKASLLNKTSAIAVSGVFKSLSAIQYDGTTTQYKIPGAYYSISGFSYVSPLATAAGTTATTVYVYGTVTAGDVAFKGTATSTKYLYLAADSSLTMGTLTLDYTVFEQNAASEGQENSEFTGVIAHGDAAVAAVDAYLLKVACVDGSDDILFVSNVLTGDESLFTITAGTVAVGAIAGQLIIAEGAEMVIPSAGTAYLLGEIVVYGTLTVGSGESLTGLLVSCISVIGTLDVASETDTQTAGTLEVDQIYAGITAEDFDDMIADDTAASAVLSGPMDYDVLAVMPWATVSDETVKDMRYTAYFVDDELYVTVYVPTTLGEYYINDLTYYDVAVDFYGWLTEDATAVLDTVKIGATGYEAVYAVVDHDVYTLFVRTDNGVKSVAVNGKELINTANNVFVSYDDVRDLGFLMSEGKYTITFTLKDGYEGTPILYDADGKAVIGGYGITVDGIDRTVTYQLTGTQQIEPEPTPEPEKESEWTITTILLVILVILIAIMAVIVALRLNRN